MLPGAEADTGARPPSPPRNPLRRRPDISTFRPEPWLGVMKGSSPPTFVVVVRDIKSQWRPVEL